MEFAVRFFLIVFFRVFKRYWYISGIPILAMVVHGAYTGSWYVLSSVIASFVIAAVITINVMKQPM